MWHILKPLAESILIPVGLTVAASVTDATIEKKIFVSSMTKLIISNEEMDDTMKMIKTFQESGLLIKTVSKAIKDEAKEQKSGFSVMLLGTLGASLLGNLWKDKGVTWSKIPKRGVIRAPEGTARAGEEAIRAGQNF